jgi:hypothetical protein
MDIKDILNKIKGLVEPPKSTSGFAYVFWVPNYSTEENKHGDFKAAPAESLLGPKASLLLQVTALSEGTFIFGPFPANNKEEAIRAFGEWMKECGTRGVSVFDQDKHIPRKVVREEILAAIAEGSVKARAIVEKGDMDPDIRKDLAERIHRYDTKKGKPCSNCGEIHDEDESSGIEVKVIAIPVGGLGRTMPGLPPIEGADTKDFGPN